MGKTVSKVELAEIFGVSERTLSTYQRAGLPVDVVGGRGVPNQYDTEKVFEWLLRREIEKLTNGAGEIVDYEGQRTRLTKAQADHEEMKVALLRGESLPTPMVVAMCQAAVNSARSRLLGLHVKVKSRCPGIDDDTLEEIAAQVRESLAELGSNGLPEQLRKRVEQYFVGVESAAELDAESVG